MAGQRLVPPMKVLVAEDDPRTAAYLEAGLSQHGFVVDLAVDGEEALAMTREMHYDIMILDVMLPKRDGWSVMSEVRRTDGNLPVLFLTAKDGIANRVHGLELGADDYLVKPFAFSELLARLRAIMRRNPQRQPETLRIADLEIDLFAHKARRNSIRLDLSPKEFALLSLLARRKGEVLSRTVIAEQIWDMNFDPTTNVVDVHIRRLRAKVDDPFPMKLIHTVRGVGYVLDVDN
jgi:two-component system copper resistance phosphate regulon response regulator CusR